MNQDVDNQLGGYEPERDKLSPLAQSVAKGVEQIRAMNAGEYEECAIENATVRVHEYNDGVRTTRGMRAKESVDARMKALDELTAEAQRLGMYEHTPGIGRNASLALKQQDSTADALSEECKESQDSAEDDSVGLQNTQSTTLSPAPAANALKQLSYAVAYAERNGRSPREAKQDQRALEIMQHLVLTASSVLYHDERGQGVGYSESMQELHALVGETTRTTRGMRAKESVATTVGGGDPGIPGSGSTPTAPAMADAPTREDGELGGENSAATAATQVSTSAPDLCREAFDRFEQDELDPDADPLAAVWLKESFIAGYKAALAASPVHAELARVSANLEMERIENAARDDTLKRIMEQCNTAVLESEEELERVKAECERLRECLQFFQDGQHNKPKHILSFNDRLTDEEFERIRQQCNKEFGEGMFLLLEGGLKYEGMTHYQALQQNADNFIKAKQIVGEK